MTTYTHISDLAKETQPPETGILGRTIFNDETVKAVIFGFGQGEELSEHTASMPAVLHFLQGETTVGLGDDKHETRAGKQEGRRSQILNFLPCCLPYSSSFDPLPDF